MALIFSLSHNNSVNTRPGLKEQTNDTTFPLVSPSHRGGFGEGRMGMVIFKSGGMMFKLKNKFFSFPETLFIYF